MEIVGYCEDSKNEKYLERRSRDIIEFVRIGNEYYGANKLYIGNFDRLSYLLEDEFVWIDCAGGGDYNFDAIKSSIKYDMVFCFELLEHVQNPLFLLKGLVDIIKDTGVIYLSTPHRPRWMWPDYHYNEISAKHMQKWLLDPLNLEIIRKKKLRVIQHWSDYLIGVRPILRAIKNRSLKEIIGKLTNTTWIYEIR